MKGPATLRASRAFASMQMARLASTATAVPSASGIAAFRRLSDLQRLHQRIKALGEQPVDLAHHTRAA